jgi:2,3-bisphosphoglycerate-independent phosphoglycerate mutase
VEVDSASIATVQDNDSIIFFDYRNDRIKQIVAPFVEQDFNSFNRKRKLQNLFVVSMTSYSKDLPVDAVAYEAIDLQKTLGDIISEYGLRQIRIAEQEKEAHVTSFFDGGLLKPLQGSEHIIVPSKKLPQNELANHPAMATDKIVETVLSRMNDDISLCVINFANCDMVAHTGNLEATITALGIVDNALKTIIEQIRANPNYTAVITCDHGNSEEVIDPLTGGPDMQHSANHVPAIIVGKGLELSTQGEMNLKILSSIKPSGSLIDIAPTVLHLFGFDKPSEMTGQSLI